MWDFLELQSFVDKWQDILRLRDWDIKLELVTKEWRKTGDVKIDRDDKKAIVLINDFNPKQTNMEATIIHELLHIKLYGMDQMIEELLHGVYGDDEKDQKLLVCVRAVYAAAGGNDGGFGKGLYAIGRGR